MAGLIARLWSRRPAETKHRQRAFDGARVDRLTASWIATNTSIDQGCAATWTVCARARVTCSKTTNTRPVRAPGAQQQHRRPEGFILHARAPTPRQTRHRSQSRDPSLAFWDWCKPRHCDVIGRRAFVDVVRMAVVSMARDGEF